MRGDWAHFIHESLMQVGVDAVNPYLLEDFSRNYEILFNDDFLPFWYSKEMQADRVMVCYCFNHIPMNRGWRG